MYGAQHDCASEDERVITLERMDVECEFISLQCLLESSKWFIDTVELWGNLEPALIQKGTEVCYLIGDRL